ncbi:MAG: exosortase family protein XrtF [Bacteroidota bacterium]
MKKNKAIIIFLIKFFATYFILSGVYSIYLHKTQKKSGIFSCAPITRQVAEHTNTFSKFFGFNSSIEQNESELSIKFFLNDHHVINIVEGCSSISIIILFISFIIAFTGSIKDTIFFGVFGVVAIYLVNLLRILLLAILYQKYPQHEYLLHNLFFPAIVYGFVFFLWVIWVKYFSHYKELKNVKNQ